MKRNAIQLLVAGVIALSACQDNVAPRADGGTTTTPSLAKSKTPLTGTPAERAAQIATGVNAYLAGRGSKLRLVGADFFTIGKGVPAFRTLRNGARWPFRTLHYILDESDFTTQDSKANVENALVSAYESWNNVSKGKITLVRSPDTEPNPDLLDAINLNPDGTCTLFGGITDVTWQGPFADIVSGGWLNPDYFGKCLGSEDIIAVTWTFADPADLNHDGYADAQYIEQYFNAKWGYVTSGSQYLDFDGPFDIQSIAVHEDGHALGLGHFGGPNDNQPFKLHPNGRVFDPEAVMNPFSLGGEKRNQFPTDIAAISTLYSRSH